MLLLAAVASVVAPLPVRAEPPAELSEVEQLVEQLGDSEFTTRERATARLLAVGLRGKAALEAGSEHPDREIRYRSRRILAQIKDLDFENRLQAFIDDPTGEAGQGLPGWQKYRSFAGNDQDVRKLFVEMQRSEHELLEAVDEGPKPAADALSKRVAEIQLAMQAHRNQVVVNVGTISTLLFAALQGDTPLAPSVGQTVANFLYQPSFNNAIHGGGNRPAVLRRMLGEWIRRRTTDANSYQAIMLSLRYDVKEGLIPAQRILRTATQQINQPVNAHLRQYGLLTVARFGDEEHIPLVEPMLEDKTNYGGQIRINNKNVRTQIRDIALATLVKLSGQEHRDYGFDRLQPHSSYVFNSSTLAFVDEKKREESIKKWRDYRSATGKKDAPEAPAEKPSKENSEENGSP